ncbi:unnamed protein product (mitochondrion) [Plasmodiophora brassicae]|uniref:Uncharacterized protein n=1 Tax=Plasmodiophora brassicae TaxID=37360 RepID=A0A0G4IWN9_PLABS|nr:hypothetical protein PBRA_007448 [Plasmodiophora brassicae]SPQ97126.1 unnamed protein product [Plasmodiophora brassicae]
MGQQGAARVAVCNLVRGLVGMGVFVALRALYVARDTIVPVWSGLSTRLSGLLEAAMIIVAFVVGSVTSAWATSSSSATPAADPLRTHAGRVRSGYDRTGKGGGWGPPVTGDGIQPACPRMRSGPLTSTEAIKVSDDEWTTPLAATINAGHVEWDHLWIPTQ